MRSQGTRGALGPRRGQGMVSSPKGLQRPHSARNGMVWEA